ncbi:hypothetical protein A3Q56_08295 [Intoshia linei]|uniref:Uncharacterized protein n=1 Tax=Intoshia linei TaxID=1819745 RepID=A0A177APP7_9BILA|nr:hypothetical protein A3Q56_08295 [Intoshia linei]
MNIKNVYNLKFPIPVLDNDFETWRKSIELWSKTCNQLEADKVISIIFSLNSQIRKLAVDKKTPETVIILLDLLQNMKGKKSRRYVKLQES